MKIRNGFVSNSSSSSFCIIGMPFDEDDLRNYIAKVTGQEGFDTDDEDIDVEEFLDSKDISYENGIGEYYEQIIVGKYYSDMKPNETKAQFEERVKKAIENALPGIDEEIKVALHYDGGYEG